MSKKFFLLLVLILFVFKNLLYSESQLYCATFYVDFDFGDDNNDGTSPLTPWKHCPGDINAKGNAGAKSLSAGDTVLFKGGVKYRGHIENRWNGSSMNPIVYKGNGWGNEKAIITGTEILSQPWTRCVSSADCWNNPNWANIWYTTIPPGKSWLNRLYQDGIVLHIAQSPSPSDPLFWANLSEWYPIKVVDNTDTTIRDSSVFIQSDPNYYAGTWVFRWMSGNSAWMKEITSFNPSTNTITHAPMPNAAYKDRDSYYSILNHPAFIDKPGKYAFRHSENRIYLWPYNNANPNNVTIEMSERYFGITSTGYSYITIEGFKAYGMHGSPNTDLGAVFSLTNGTGFTIRDIEAYYMSDYNQMRVLRAWDNIGGAILIENNYIHDCFKNRGIFATGGPGSIVRNNIISRMGHTGIWINGSNGLTATGNRIISVRGVHANGQSIYSSSNIRYEKNYIYDAATLLTVENGSNYIIINNIFDGNGYGYLEDWGGMTGYLYFINNTLVNGDSKMMRMDSSNTVCLNNVMTGTTTTACDIHQYNIYTSENHPTLGVGEQRITNLSLLFRNPSGGDYTPLSGGPLIDSGTNVSSYGVNDDYVGTPRPQGGGWDIGAYEDKYGNPRPPRGLRIIQQ